MNETLSVSTTATNQLLNLPQAAFTESLDRRNNIIFTMVTS